MIDRVLRQLWLVLLAVVSLTGLPLLAQTAPVAAPPANGQGAAAAAPARQGAPAAGRAGRGGRGGRQGVDVGGSQMDDPAYAGVDFSKKDAVLPQAPADEAKRFWLQPGFKIEPVLTDPDIEESAQIAFDGNGRLFVLELRGYMQTADAEGEMLPVGRISVHEDRDGDGVYETHHVFVDHLAFPRFVMPFGPNAILTKESNADEVWKYTDTDGDGSADKKELFTTGFGRLANVEHQEAGLFWAMDNWMYSTINQFRVRWTPHGILREPTGSNGAQWGATQDNYGKVWFQGGASGMPGYFQFPVVYGNFTYPDQFEPDLSITWGAPVRIADMQGGLNVTRMPDGSLARATAGTGNDVYRGDRLPKDLVGDYFYGEAVARIVRRLHPVKTEGLTELHNVYPLAEFIRSTDPLFRPVDITTAPDGTMYITDMYRGIIQESQWSGPGTYLRARIEQYALDKVVRHGRVWRLTYEGMPRDTTQPRMLDETPAQLVAHLSHPNGWWRDTAQRLLVMRQDMSVVPALEQLARSSTNQLARIHALWTLEGLGAATPALVRDLMTDADPQIRAQAIRVSETLYKAGDKSFGADYAAMTKDVDVDVAIQALMTLNTLKVPNANETVRTTMTSNKAKGVQLVGSTILNPPAGRGGLEAIGRRTLTPAETTVLEKGQTIYTEVCFACHGTDGRGTPMAGAAPGVTMAPPLASSPRVVGHRDYVIQVLLHGLTGPINGERYSEVMIPMGENPDDWVAAIGSYVRNAFGNSGALITPADVARVRGATAARRTSPTVDEIQASLPHLLVVDSGWKVTASHNAATAPNALTIQPWSTGERQAAGMWLQVELPQAVRLTEIEFESAPTDDPATAGRGAAPTTVLGAPPRTGGGPTGPLGYPRAYQVQVSTDGSKWSAPVARGEGTGGDTVIAFSPVNAKFVRITQTGRAADAPPWNVQRLRLYEAAAR